MSKSQRGPRNAASRQPLSVGGLAVMPIVVDVVEIEIECQPKLSSATNDVATKMYAVPTGGVIPNAMNGEAIFDRKVAEGERVHWKQEKQRPNVLFEWLCVGKAAVKPPTHDLKGSTSWARVTFRPRLTGKAAKLLGDNLMAARPCYAEVGVLAIGEGW